MVLIHCFLIHFESMVLIPSLGSGDVRIGAAAFWRDRVDGDCFIKFLLLFKQYKQ